MEYRIKIIIVALVIVALSLVSIQSLLSNIFNQSQGSEILANEKDMIVGEFIGNYLNSEFVPSWLKLEQGMTPNGKTGPDTVYGYNCEINGTEFYASIEYNSNNSQVLKKFIRISDSFKEIDTEIATLILDTYFKTHGEVKCTNTTVIKSPYCESYLIDGGNKIFIGALSGNFTGELTAFVCEYPVGSEIYSWNSCNKVFKEVGVATPPYTLPGE